MIGADGARASEFRLPTPHHVINSLAFMIKTRFGLVDCNNFYASCERVFRPDLAKSPIAVLSNNDGCIVAMSAEAKAAGIPRGKPLFQYRKEIREHNVQVFSSNYTLYGDMSRRVMEVLSRFSPDVDPYSIDEAFIDLSGVPDEELAELGKTIRQTVMKWTGIPVTIGIAPSRTLAKVAAGVAKRDKNLQGAFSLVDHPNVNQILKETPVEDIWGIGRGFADRLRQNGIGNALQLSTANLEWVRRKLTIVGMRCAQELQGISCVNLEDVEPGKRSLMFTRSFGHPVTEFAELEEAVSFYTARCAEKLRAKGLVTGMLTLYLREYQQGGGWHTRKMQESVALDEPTDFTPLMIRHVQQMLTGIFVEGIRYKKAGIMMTDLAARDQLQLSLFRKQPRKEDQRLMKAIDLLNEKLGKGTVFTGKEGTDQEWQMKSEFKSPRYSTNWKEIPVVNTDLPGKSPHKS